MTALPSPDELAKTLRIPCADCDGTGVYDSYTCLQCDGHGNLELADPIEAVAAIREDRRLIVEWIDGEERRVAEFRTHALFEEFGDVNGQAQYERALAAVRAAIVGEEHGKAV